MRNKIVLDSCVFVKIFLNEGDLQKAADFLETSVKEGTMILVPEIFIYEVFSVAVKESAPLKKVSFILNKQKSLNLKVINITEDLIQNALNIIEKNSHPKSGFPSFYDAVYHALAILNNCKFITADKKHYEKAKNEGFIELF